MMTRLIRVAGLALTPLLGGCGSAEVSDCQTPEGEGYLCPKGTICAPEGTPAGCYEESQLVDDCKALSWSAEDKEAPTSCKASGFDGYCLGQVCLPTTCGDGIRSGLEECDLGDAEKDEVGWFERDGEEKRYLCANTCLSKLECGNGKIDDEVGEVCDDGNTESDDGCSSDCKINEFCGNGKIDTFNGIAEVCDPGNDPELWNGVEYERDAYNNWIAPAGQQSCSRSCSSTLECGNGVKDGPFGPSDTTESCDNGGRCDDGLPCTSHQECKTGQCEPQAGDGCNAECTGTERCGDGLLDNDENVPESSREICDPGDDEAKWADKGISHRDSDGNWIGFDSADSCTSNCLSRFVCGNGTLDLEERCDDGNLRNHDGCNSVCQLENVYWQEWVSPRAGSPSAIAHDLAREETIMVSGTHPLYLTALTWRWDLELGAWQRIRPAHSPPPVARPTLAYDEARGVIVTLGQEGTWEWNGTDWIKHDAALPTHSELRPALAYDYQREKVVTIERAADSPETIALWAWDGSTWSEEDTDTSQLGNHGLALRDFGIVSDPITRQLYVLGGLTRDGSIRKKMLIVLNTENEWRTSTPHPRQMTRTSLTYHPTEKRIYAIGGGTTTTLRRLSHLDVSDPESPPTWTDEGNMGHGIFTYVGGAYVPQLDAVLVSGGRQQSGRSCVASTDCGSWQCTRAGQSCGDTCDADLTTCEAGCSSEGNSCRDNDDCGEEEQCLARSEALLLKNAIAEPVPLIQSPEIPKETRLQQVPGRPWAIHIDAQERTWRFDGIAWELRANPAVPPLVSPSHQSMLVHAATSGEVFAIAKGTVWRWHDDRDEWTEVAVSADPWPAFGAIRRDLTTDPSSGAILHYDFDNQSSENGALWELSIDGDTASWTQRALENLPLRGNRDLVSNSFSAYAIGGDVDTGDTFLHFDSSLTAFGVIESSEFVPLKQHGLAYDFRRDLFVIFGGKAATQSVHNYTFELIVPPDREATWLETSNPRLETPASRSYPAMTGLSHFGVAMVGGFSGAGTFQDTWLYGAHSQLPDEQCGNEIDDDGDGLVDCLDAGDCVDSPFCPEL